MSYTIGEVARQAEINVSTLRFYERRGLLPEPPRNSYGHRVYGSEEVLRLRFIRRAQALGFSLAEIRELLELRSAPGTDCDGIRAHAERRLEATNEKIEGLVEVRDVLQGMVGACSDRSEDQPCPAIAHLENGHH